MNMRLTIGCLLVLWSAVAGRSVYALELLYPSDRTAVTNSNYLIIKGGEAPRLSGISVEINGITSDIFDISAPDYQASFDDMLILAPDFDPGVNAIKLTGYVSAPVVEGQAAQVDKVEEVVATIFYVDGVTYLAAPEGYPSYVMHTPAHEAVCQRCHNMNPVASEMDIPDPVTNPCGACHARMLDTKHVHGPAGVFQCARCHDPATRPQKYQVVVNDRELCGECHQEDIDDIDTAKFQHGPAAVGMCSVCHDAHSSNQFAQLRLFVNDLCLNCHSSVAGLPHVIRNVGGKSHPLRGVDDPSRPGRELTCASCHNPHSAASSFYFQGGVESRFALCGLCHKK